MNKVSVIVPVYNVEKYLSDCVESILSQTYANFELILIDDGSTDSSGIICDNYSKNDDRIKVVHKMNGGLSSARNRGLDCATGDFISFVDSDDVVDKTFLEKLLIHFENCICDISMCVYKTFFDVVPCNESKNNLELVFNEEDFWNYHFEEANDVVTVNKLYRAHLFENIRFPEGVIYEDEYILHKIISQCRMIHYSAEALYFYRQRPLSIMSSFNPLANLDGVTAFVARAYYLNEKGFVVPSYSAFNTGVSYLMRSFRRKEKKKSVQFNKKFSEKKKELKALAKRIIVNKISFKRKFKIFVFLSLPSSLVSRYF